MERAYVLLYKICAVVLKNILYSYILNVVLHGEELYQYEFRSPVR